MTLRKLALQLLLTCSSMQSIPVAAQVQEACCGPSSMYNEQNSTPLQYQEDNEVDRACCGLGSWYEIERARERQQQEEEDER